METVRTTHRSCIGALAVCAALVSAARAPGGEVLADEWMIVRIAGQPAGSAHMLATTDGEFVRTRLSQTMTMERMGVPITQEVTQDSLERADGTPVSFRQTQNVAAEQVTVDGRIEGGTLTLTSATMGTTRTRTLEWPAGTKFGYDLERHVRANTTKTGSSFGYRTYSIELDRFVDVTHEVVAELEIDVLGQRVRVFKSLVKGLYPGITPIEYRDADGVTWKGELGVMGINLEMLRTTEAGAAVHARARANFDALTDLSVTPDRRIARPREVNAATYRLRLKDGAVGDLALDAPGQRVIASQDAAGTVIEVTSIVPDAARILPHPIRDESLKKFLEASTYVQSDDPELARVARAVAGEVRSSYAAAKRLESWVYRNVTAKGFDRGFATAKEVLQDRAGDCTEHGVLLCALLRAVGIPARVAAGLEYVDLPDGRAFFGYHMWTEAYVGVWVPLDGTLGGRFVDATHIRLSASDLAGMSPAGGMLEIFQVFGQLEIDVVTYAHAPRTGADDVAGVEGRCHDRSRAFSFAAPAGWTVLRPGAGRLDEPEAYRLLRTGGLEAVSIMVVAAAPGTTLSDVVERASAGGVVSSRFETRVDGVAAARLSYEKRAGTRREAVAFAHEGTVFVVRLEPPTDEGRAGLDAVVNSFRFE